MSRGIELPARSSAVWLVASWLAAWRLTSLIAYEAGPFDMMPEVRLLMARNGLGKLVACFHCLGFWISLGVVGLTYGVSRRSALLAIAVAGATSVTERAITSASEEPREGDERVLRSADPEADADPR